jgi:hypothetical protein
MAKEEERSEFLDALRKGLLVGAAILVLVIPPLHLVQKARAPAPPVVSTAPPAATAPAAPGAPSTPPVASAPPSDSPVPPPVAQTAPPTLPRSPAPQFADFDGKEASDDVRHIANWAVFTRDHKRMSFVVVDKKGARVYVFGPDGKLKDSAPALLGAARGDHTVPGIGDKPLSQVKPDEKTTPAGRFIAEPGINTKGEDIVWVDYDAAVSMHRVRPLVKAERRLERLASPTVADNRISFGCINLPVAFYEKVLSPTVKKAGAVVYVLPETRPLQKEFGSWDVKHPGATAHVAQRQ